MRRTIGQMFGGAFLKAALKPLMNRLAAWQPIRSAVLHLVYPNIVRALLDEVQPDTPSPSGVVEAWAWKIHSQILRSEEMADGENCAEDGMRCDANTRRRILDVVAQHLIQVPGEIFEFGVSSGESFLEFLNRFPARHVYGFDSFEGLPEDWWTRPKGTFAAEPPRFTSPYGHLIKGWYNESAPSFFSGWTGVIALLHIDCDLYSSSAIAIGHAIKYCVPGSVVLFDEYYNYPGFESHEWRAWREARALYAISARCIAYDGRRAAFVIEKRRQT